MEGREALSSWPIPRLSHWQKWMMARPQTTVRQTHISWPSPVVGKYCGDRQTVAQRLCSLTPSLKMENGL